MDPNNQPGQLPPTQSPAPQGSFNAGQYDFITNPVKPPKKGLFGGGKGRSGTLMIIAGGLVGFTLILLIGSLFLGGGGGDKETLLDVAQKQSQIISIAGLGADDAGTNQAQSLALAVQLSVTSEQQALVANITKRDKVKPKDYAAGAGSEVTQQLENAQRNGNFDAVFTTIIKDQLTQYQQELRTANNSVSSKSTKELLAKNYESAGILLQIPSVNQ